MIVSRKKEKCNFHKKIGGHEISQNQFISYLGVVFDEFLIWKQYIERFLHLSNDGWALSQIRKYADSQTVKKVYSALLYPHIHYCITN